MIDVIVIGGGPAGMSVALNLLRAGHSVLILEKENFGGQIANSPRVENIPGIKEISGLELATKKALQAIGDANTALQYALMLANTCSNVYMFTLFDRFFADQILIDRLIQKDNIHITHNMNLVAYLGQNELAGLRFENTMDHTIHEYPTNNVFVAIGQVSQNDLFKSLVETDDHGFIITNERMETSLPGIFAIGDTRKKDVRQVASAVGDASIASVFIDKYLMFNNR